MALLGVAFGMCPQEAGRVVHDGSFRRFADLAPATITQTTEKRGLSSNPDVAGNEIGLADWDVQGALIPVFDDQFLVLLFSPGQSPVSANTVVGVNNEVSFIELIQFGGRGC